MKHVWTILAVLLVASTASVASDLNLAGGMMFSGKSITYTVGGSFQVVQSPGVYLDLLYSPEVGEASLGLSVPVSVGLDPLAKWLGFEWAPWAESAMDRVNLGLAAWKTQDEFPMRGGLYFKVTALEWGF
jgi:hypothetical protein